MASQGLYGNTPKTWNSVDEFLNDFKGDAESEKVGLRSLDVSSPACKSDIQVSDLIRETQNLRPGNFVITQIPQNQDKEFPCLQGEIGFVFGNLQMHYTHHWGYMREKLAKFGKYAGGFRAPIPIIQRFCDRKSQDMLWELLARYAVPCEDLTIEFTVFPPEIPRIGIFPDHNTLVWEVRHY